MKILEQEITVSKNDLDDLNHVNNVVYVNWIQEIAKNHWNVLVSDEIKENYYWVLLEHHIKYLHSALLNEKIIFGIGASIASFLFFFLLGYLSKVLSRYAKSKKVWNIINLFIIIFMSFLTLLVFLETIN